MVSFFAEVKIFLDYNPWFDFRSPKIVLRKVYYLIGNEKRNLTTLVSAA